ncbi:hypothetical protein FVF58_47170 [Paraburkholderia panacisoli]|uniref:Uncharacterized protein n=1 Tax=Paraburkholderia panacisoli TaxID=2603818 RepID=A0A5B0G555_9BURK|nr:hypothetical protein FVF58_47170 [Paraburkholderia panacisoli]
MVVDVCSDAGFAVGVGATQSIQSHARAVRENHSVRTGATPHQQPKPASRYATSEWDKPLQHPLSGLRRVQPR